MTVSIERRVGLADRVLNGDRRALARALSLVETGGFDALALQRRLYAHTGRARIIGVTGPPGVGKSTLVNEVALELRRRTYVVAIIAVDPSSPFSGGAILGDRIRMQALGGDSGVFMRSMASRGQLGGLARATSDMVSVFDAAKFDWIIIETVGAGQAEVDIAREAHTTLVAQAPGMGDDVQAIKAGILEIADIFVINKADREGAEHVRRQLKMMMELASSHVEWKSPIIATVATRGQGITELVDAVERHRAFLHASGALAVRERERVTRQLRMLVGQMVLEQIDTRVPEEQRTALLELVQTRALDPYAAAEQLLSAALVVGDPI